MFIELNAMVMKQGKLDIYKKIRFGNSTLHKAIKKAGSLDNWLDSHPLYREHYERNFKLVMEEGIPDDIRTGILESYKNAKTDYNSIQFEEYLKTNNLAKLLLEIGSIFKPKGALTAADFGW